MCDVDYYKPVVASHRLRSENARGEPSTRRPLLECRCRIIFIVAIAVTFIVHGNDKWKPAVRTALTAFAQPRLKVK